MTHEQPNRRAFLRNAALGAASLALSPLAGGARKRPNVLILFTDDQRFDTVHELDNPDVRTPNMDRMVRAGTSFTRACIMGGSISAVCAPSRAMLMTGQTLWHVTDSIVEPKRAGRPPKPFVMFPEMFRKAGYATFGTGKWHNGERLFARCFDRGENIFFGGMSNHLEVPVHDFDPTGRYPKEKQRIGRKFSSELFADSTIRFLREYGEDKPFLAYTAFTAPHDPRMAPREYVDMYPSEKIPVPGNFLPVHPFDNGEMKGRDESLAPWPRTPQIAREHIAAYYAMITHLDAQIGRVLDALEDTGRARDTIVMFAGDNGLAVGQHGLFGKQNLYDHSIRVPLVIGGAGLPRGQRAATLCYLLDLFPTLCDLTGLPIPETVEGRSLAPVLQDPDVRVRDSVYAAFRHFQRGLRTGEWKLIRYHVGGKDTTQLFDLAGDPLETRNLADNPNHAGRVSEMNALLKKWMRETGDPLDLDKPAWGYVAQAGVREGAGYADD